MIIQNAKLNSDTRIPVAISIVAVVVALAALLTKAPASQQSAVNNQPSTKTEKVVVEQSTAVTKVVKEVSPSVVAITSKTNITDFFGNTQSVEGAGTGFIITADGMIATNKHVVQDGTARYTVITHEGKQFTAEVLAADPFQDLAIVKIDAKDLPVVKLGDSDRVQIGEWAVAIGNALGEFQNSVTVGVISGKERSLKEAPELEGLLQTDAAINPGNSGGPLVNLSGQVIGINTAVVRGGAEGLGFAIPVNNVKKVIDSVKRTGKIVRPYLGVQYILLDRKTSVLSDLPVEEGAYVAEVVKGGPAEKAGVKKNDIIVEFDGKKVSKDNPLARLIADKAVGDKVTVKIRRGDKEVSLQVMLEEFKQ